MSFYCFETRQDRTLAPYPPPEFSQQIEKMSPSEIVDHIINTNIDQLTLSKIEKAIAVPLRQLISPRENRRRRAIPRPQNNFVLYRRNFHAVITKEQGHGVAKNFKLISNEAAKNWSEESNEIKQLYELIADCAKKVHDCTYPQYVYQPKHKSNKKGANGTIFREVTVDSCSKKNDKKEKDMKELLKEKEDLKRDKITMTKSFVASTTFLADIHPPSMTSITNKINSELALANDDNNKKWRWAHYTQSDPPNNVNNNSNVNNINIINHNHNNHNNHNNNNHINNHINNNHINNNHINNNHINNSSNSSSSSSSINNSSINNSSINNSSNNNNNSNSNSNNSNSNNNKGNNSNNNKNNNNVNVNVNVNVNDSDDDTPMMEDDVPPSPTISATPPPPPLPSLLPPIDIPISSNFLATYDRNIWSLVNGFTNV